MPDPLVLASASPQRRAILTQLGVAFELVPADVDELEEGLPPSGLAEANARAKAEAIAARFPARTVLGVDTVVALDGAVYGKPADAAAARATLTRLAGRTHTVVSGIAVVDAGVGGGTRSATASTDVEFRPLTDRELDAYVALREWEGRAGGYAIQGRGAALVERIAGDYLNVVGLPVAALGRLLPGLLLP